MQRDRQVVVVDAPELLEQQLGLAARVDEEQRRPVLPDRLVDLAAWRSAPYGRPRARAPRNSRIEMSGLAPPDDGDQLGHVAAAGFCADQPAAQLVRLGDGRRQADRLQAGREPAQPRQAERQQIAALRGDQRMQLVEDRHIADPRRSARRPSPASSSATCSGVVSRMSGGSSFWRWRLCAGVSPVRVSMRDRQAHLGDRLLEVALDVDGQRLQRRDVERVDAAMRLARLALRPRRRDRSASAGSRPASCRRRSARSAAPTAGLRLRQQLELVRARRPAARREPSYEWFRQDRGRVSGRS